ncbi:hypothetical protein Cpin_6200 [Chitinophaga pinensis DSM 2588]|uniref:Uncharacterized protein n=1 Tax=Chitinophaga pinensis (strain ATCC 43595 / DSM 2588 / LMG 13176 / NBRC 15968 / NCIMB 11800 / UQM 2034) TaxID=485918 RepID=A0A979GZ28_CHIPD|nr:hypothetical protein Cpin_6200 [Chitinophaga pinensis DSM 2588]
MVVGIFRTNICTQQDKLTIINAIRTRFDSDCTIDIEDCDKVMRIVPGSLSVAENDIIQFVGNMGFRCELLD